VIPTPIATPNLFLRATSTSTEPLDAGWTSAAAEAAAAGVTALTRAEEAAAVFPESISRCNRFRSARNSAATW
jgi:hypothetical protein